MQRPDPNKRREIMAVAARMFAERHFHEVRLDEIAKATRLGKGTIYVYFDNKDELYFTLIADGMDQLVAELNASSPRQARSSWSEIERLLQSLLGFADRFPHLYELMRGNVCVPNERLMQKRAELVQAITRVLRRGIKNGELRDPHPELTAGFLLGSVRAALLAPSGRMGRKAIASHILRVLGDGILARKRR